MARPGHGRLTGEEEERLFKKMTIIFLLLSFLKTKQQKRALV